MKGKIFKKGISAVLTLAMTLGCASAFAMVVPPSDAVPTGTVLKESDFESSNKLFNQGEIKKLEDGNNVLNITSKNWGELNLGNSSLAKGRDMVISFSAMTGASDGFKLFLRKKGSASAYLDFAGIEFTTDGKIKANDGIGALGSVYNSEICTYDADKWYNIDMVICDAASESYDTYVEYYVNGELKKTISSKKLSSTNKDNTMPLSYVFVSNTSGETENIANYIDNFKVYYTDTTEKYYAYGDTDKAVTDGTVNVEFSETPLATKESAKLYSPVGGEIAVSGQTVDGRFAKYSFDKSLLSEEGEYTLVLPQTESVTGKKLANNVVVFDKKDGIKVNEVRYISEYNFDDCTEGADGAATMLNGISAGYGGNYSLIPSEIVSDGKSGKGLMFNYTHSSGNIYTEGNSLTGFKSPKAFDTAKVSGLNEFIAEFDIKAPEQNGKIVSPSFYLYVGGTKAGLIIIDKNGYLVAAKSVNANGNIVYEWSGVVDENGNYKSGFSEETHSVIKTTAGQWYNVKMGLVPSKNEIRYYVDDKFIGSYVNDTLSGKKPSELRIAANDYGDKSGTIPQKTAIDNVRFGWTLGDTLKTVEDVNGQINNPAVEDPEPDEGTAVWKMKNDSVQFVQNSNAEFDSGALIVSTDVTLETIKPNVGVLIETKHKKGCPLVSVSILNESGDIGVDSTSSNTTGKYSVADKYSKFSESESMTVLRNIFKSNIPVNITAYMDANREYIYVFINKMYATKLEISKLQGSTAKVFDANNDGSISDDEITPGNIVIRQLYGARNQGAYKVENIKLMSVDNTQDVKSIRLTAKDGSENEEFTLYNNNIPANINKITLSYGAALTSIENAEITLKNKNGDKTIPITAELSADKKTIALTILSVLTNDTYVLSVKNITGVRNLQREFNVRDDRGIVFDKFSVEKNTDGKYYADLSVTNYSVFDKSFTLIICEYSNAEIPEMLGIEQISINVKSGQSISLNDSNLSLEPKSANSKVKAFIWNNISKDPDGNTTIKDSAEYQTR